MPTLFYGTLDQSRKRQLYAESLRPIESSIFDRFEIDDLAPYDPKPFVGLFWHFRSLGHSALSWHDDRKIEQTVFIPSPELTQPQMFEVCRLKFPTVLPSPLVFRVSNHYEPYTYD